MMTMAALGASACGGDGGDSTAVTDSAVTTTPYVPAASAVAAWTDAYENFLDVLAGDIYISTGEALAAGNVDLAGLSMAVLAGTKQDLADSIPAVQQFDGTKAWVADQAACLNEAFESLNSGDVSKTPPALDDCWLPTEDQMNELFAIDRAMHAGDR